MARGPVGEGEDVRRQDVAGEEVDEAAAELVEQEPARLDRQDLEDRRAGEEKGRPDPAQELDIVPPDTWVNFKADWMMSQSR